MSDPCWPVEERMAWLEPLRPNSDWKPCVEERRVASSNCNFEIDARSYAIGKAFEATPPTYHHLSAP